MNEAAPMNIAAATRKWGNYGTRRMAEEEHPLVEIYKNSAERSMLVCFRWTTTRKVAGWFLLNSVIFAATAYAGISELLGARNFTNLTYCTFFNGASISAYGYLALWDNPHRQKTSALISAWSYEFAVLFFAQLYLNLVPDSQLKLWALPFCWTAGLLEAKDMLALASMKLSDLPLSTKTPAPENIIPSIGFHTRNNSPGAKMWLAFLSMSAGGLTVFNFVYQEQYLQQGDLGKIGFYQDLIALFSGSVLGELVTRFADNYKEALEGTYDKFLPVNQRVMPIRLKVLRIAKNAFVLLTPSIIGGLLTVPTDPNTIGDFAGKAMVGAIYGAQFFIAKREFENGESPIHHRLSLIEGINSSETTTGKVKRIARKYLPSVLFFAAWTAYMGVAASTNTPRAGWAILVNLATMYLCFGITDRLAARYKPSQNRFLNSLAFRLLYSPVSLSIIYQYLTMLVNMGDEYLNSDSNPKYGLGLVAWASWGLGEGNNRALFMNSDKDRMTSPLATEELWKVLLNNLK